MKAVELQQLTKSEVIVFHSVEEHAMPTGIVMAPSYGIPQIYSIEDPDIQRAKEVYEKNAQSIVDKAEEIFAEYGVKIETRLVYREHPVTYIDKVVEDEGIDLVIIGTKGGHSLFEEVLLGSVAEKVLRHIHCDILVIR
jgi:nucleotide-binding universal stress UspA family protein